MDNPSVTPMDTDGTFGKWYDDDWFQGVGDQGRWVDEFQPTSEKARGVALSESLSLAGNDLFDQAFSLAALISVAAGVRSRADLYFPIVCHFLWWATGNKGVDAIYSAMAGQQIARGQIRTAAVATLKDAYDFFNERGAVGPAWQKQFYFWAAFLLTSFKII